VLGEVGEQRGPRGDDLRRDALPLLRQVQAQHAPIGGVSTVFDPVSPLEIGDQSTDGALLESQAQSELPLHQSLIAGELRERMGH
jgi:hypothetical protein